MLRESELQPPRVAHHTLPHVEPGPEHELAGFQSAPLCRLGPGMLVTTD